MDRMMGVIVTIAASIVGLAALSVFLSKSSNTTSVISAGGSAFSSILQAATSPITGNTVTSVNNSGSGFNT